jgi:hypothetical protein
VIIPWPIYRKALISFDPAMQKDLWDRDLEAHYGFKLGQFCAQGRSIEFLSTGSAVDFILTYG